MSTASGSRTITWRTENANIVKLNEQLNSFAGVEGVSRGTTKVIATDQYGNIQETQISVVEVTLFSGNVTLSLGERMQLSATVIGPDGNAVSHGWFTDDSSIASIDENGMITANGIGSVNLGVSVPNAGLKWIKVTVK